MKMDKELLAALERNANRPIHTTVNMDNEKVAEAVSRTQRNNQANSFNAEDDD